MRWDWCILYWNIFSNFSCDIEFKFTLLLLLLMIWQSPGLPGWRKVNFITVTRRPHHPNIAAGLYCLATSPGFLPTLCEKWSGVFYVHRVFLSYTRDRRLKVSSERLGNEDKAPCPRALLPGRGSKIFKFVIDNSDIILNCLQHIQKRRNFDAKVTCHQPICLLLHAILSGVGVLHVVRSQVWSRAHLGPYV